MTRQRRSFDPGFKLEIVRMIKEQGLSVQHVSDTMNIGTSAIRRWVAQYAAEQAGQQRIRQLERENRQLRGDVDILKRRRPSLPAS